MQNECPDITKIIRNDIASAKQGEIINPAKYRKMYPEKMQAIIEEFISMEKGGIVRAVIRGYCPHCETDSGSLFEVFGDIPAKITCPNCGKEYPGLSNSYVFYRKV